MVRRSAWLVFCVTFLGSFGVGGHSPAGAQSGVVKLRAFLSGDQEVPPADPDGKGKAVVRLDRAAGEICFYVKFKKTGTPNRGHIHVGPAGVNGGIVVPFFELVAAPGDPQHDVLEKGDLRGCAPATEDALDAIATDPGNHYVNLHNARFPAGAIRGQLED
jgi:hypothetical protein